MSISPEFWEGERGGSMGREELIALCQRLDQKSDDLEARLRRQSSELDCIQAELVREREARLSIEREKKGLSLLDLLTRSGLTKMVDVEADPQLKRILAGALKEAILSSLPVDVTTALSQEAVEIDPNTSD